MRLILETRNLHKSFRSGETIINVITGLDLEVYEGEMIAITGESGAGKTTLLNLIGALDYFDSGKILFEGIDISKLSLPELAKYRNEKLGFIFQFHYLLPEFNALENTIFPALIKGENKDKIKQKAMLLLEELNIADRWHHRPGELSGGEQQRVAVARALINNPRLILADEPTGNLDEKNSELLFELLRKINKKYNVSFIVATHNYKLAKVCDKIYEMCEGKLKQKL
jgi:ABC-type lipoprotein export system ATPase subunit